MLGYSSEEIADALIYSFISPDDRDPFIGYRESILRGVPDAREITFAFISKGGEKIFVQGFVSAKIVDGKVLHTSGIFRDVTARLRDEAALRSINEELKERENTLQQLLFYAPDAVVAIDASSCITYWNPKAEKMFGWTQQEVLGKPLAERIIPSQYRDAHQAGMRRYLATGEHHVLNRTIEVTALDKQGREFYVSLTISPTYQKGAIAFIAFIRDIDDEKKTHRELEQKRLQLEVSNQELEQFAHVASHDMKEPVRKIRIFIERLKTELGDRVSPAIERYLSKLDTATRNLINLVDGVLAYSSLKQQKFVVESVDLKRVIETVQEDLEMMLADKQGSVRSSDLPVVEGSAFLLYQLFYNLLNNSLKFARKDVPAVIEISAKEDTEAGFFEIVVRDNGIGFPQAYAANIFNTFTRLHSKNQFEGTGLGLSICKNIVGKHRGTINAFSNEGEGATFIIRLPQKQPKE